MKILELRFKNLNSLYGEWSIDFTNPEYISNGIFVLTGATGAGKSTILDAICLALYGATPRLGKITKSTNEIMSRQTGECYAEILFESQTGRFRCHWEQRRARKKADGKLQEQEHQIIDAHTGKPIETKKSLVIGVIEEKTGMDFDRFTRSILLAQGGFDTFLKADVEQKSKILEQITGTEIYSEISCRVHERRRGEREKLDLLQAETSSIVILELEQEEEMQQNLKAKQKQETEFTGKSININESIAWLISIDGLKKEIHTLTDEAVELRSEFEAFKPERGKLERAITAALQEGRYATLYALRKLQFDDQTDLKTGEAVLPELEVFANTQAKSLKSAEDITLKAKEDIKSAAPLIQKIRFLDQKIAEQANSVSEGYKTFTKEAAKIETDKQALVKEREKRLEAKKTLLTAEQYLKEHAQDEFLISGLAGIEEQFGNLLARQKEITKKETELKVADAVLVEVKEKLDATTKQCMICKQELEEAAKKIRQGKDTLRKLLGDKLLREYRNEKETLLREISYIKKIEALEDHRSKLEDGKSCPLCGSTEHPFAKGNVPAPDEIEHKIELLTKLITNSEDQEASIKKLEEAQIAARNNLNDSETLKATALSDKIFAIETFAKLSDALEELQIGFAKLKQAVSDKLQPLGIIQIQATQLSSLFDALKLRLNSWQEQIRQKSSIEKQIDIIDSEMKRLNAVIETQNTHLTEKQENLKFLKKEHATRLDKRKKLFFDKNPDDEEYRLNKAIADAEEAEKKFRSHNIVLQQELTSAKIHVKSLKKRIDQREPDLKNSETDFSAALKSVGFAEEKQFLDARVTNEEREDLSFRAKKLDNAQSELKSRQKDWERRLVTEIAKKITDKTLEELKPQLKEYEESLIKLRDDIAALKYKLSENIAAKEQIKEKQSAIDSQKKENHRWEKLHNLIGSADGKKYRNFAQGITFGLMVSHANRQLEKMTDRYLLICDKERPLELNVVDNYQAGEIRSTRNLSGGESFIVSLTLALGLSKMASRKVRVDSLFLDEGFGTLDEETLGTALETLSGLKQDGKLIGIISHVSALKERISTQITVTPVFDGRSSLVGPGCSKLNSK